MVKNKIKMKDDKIASKRMHLKVNLVRGYLTDEGVTDFSTGV